MNLTLPTPFPRYDRWATAAQSEATRAQEQAYKDALIPLMCTISPGLASLKVWSGGHKELFAFHLGPNEGTPELGVRLVKPNQIEVRIDNGYSDGRNTFRRFAVNPDTGAINPRIVEGVRELVDLCISIVAQDAASKVRSDAANEQAARDFAHSTEVITTNGLTWAYQHANAGRVDWADYHQQITIQGRMMTVELKGLDVDRLPAVLAFIRQLNTH